MAELMMCQPRRKMQPGQVGVEFSRRLQFFQSFLELLVTQERLTLQQVERGTAFREGRQTFERGVKARFAQTQISQAEAVKHGRVRRGGVERLFELLDGLLISS